MVKAKPRCNAATHIPKVIFSAKPSEECSVDEIVKKKFTKHQASEKGERRIYSMNRKEILLSK